MRELGTLLVDDPQIEEVMDLETGEITPAAAWAPPD